MTQDHAWLTSQMNPAFLLGIFFPTLPYLWPKGIDAGENYSYWENEQDKEETPWISALHMCNTMWIIWCVKFA